MIKNIGKIKEIRLDQLKEVATFTWSVYQDPTKRTTPPYHSLEDVEKGYECTEDTNQTRVTPSALKAIQGPYSVQALTEADFEQYRAFHSKYFSSYYWSAERIYEVFEKWDVLAQYEKSSIYQFIL